MGFWKSDLKRLFIKMMCRDDDDWTVLYQPKESGIIFLNDLNNSKFMHDARIKDTVVEYMGYLVGIGGMYEDASNMNILAGTRDKPEIVLLVDFWKLNYIDGPWKKYVKVLIKELL